MLKWENVHLGQGPKPWAIPPISMTDIIKYQGASGDFQPIHHDTGFAQAAGLKQPIVIGMLPAGLAANWAADWAGPENVRVVRVRWQQPAWPGDELTIQGEVTKKYEDSEGKKIDLEIKCSKQDSNLALTGLMTFLVS
jgi:acyl dehydratase